jgi:amino acid permease
LTYFFTFNSLAFFAKTLKSIVHLGTDEDISIYWFALITILILAPLSWIRTIERFKVGFIYAGIVILIMLIVCICYVSLRIEANDN